MTDSTKAVHAVVKIGSLALDAFMLPDGTYRMSLSQAAECVGKSKNDCLRFLTSEACKRILGRTYESESIEAEWTSGQAQSKRGERYQISVISPKVVAAYWLTQTGEGNRLAEKLSWAVMNDPLDRRLDAAFIMRLALNTK